VKFGAWRITCQKKYLPGARRRRVKWKRHLDRKKCQLQLRGILIQAIGIASLQNKVSTDTKTCSGLWKRISYDYYSVQWRWHLNLTLLLLALYHMHAMNVQSGPGSAWISCCLHNDAEINLVQDGNKFYINNASLNNLYVYAHLTKSHFFAHIILLRETFITRHISEWKFHSIKFLSTWEAQKIFLKLETFAFYRLFEKIRSINWMSCGGNRGHIIHVFWTFNNLRNTWVTQLSVNMYMYIYICT